MKNRTENISVRYRPQHLTKSRFFELKNGQKAFVFEHLNTHAPYLLICYNNNYFIINYPQVLNLYQEIAKNNPANLNI